MTRDEFLDGINYFSELIDFCQEYGCDYCDDALDEDARDEEIKYELEEYGSDYSWQDIRDYLYDIPTGYDYYRRNGIFDYEGLDDTDFESYKDDVYDWAVDNDCFQINGNDIMCLGVEQGKRVGSVLNAILGDVISGSLENRHDILMQKAVEYLG